MFTYLTYNLVVLAVVLLVLRCFTRLQLTKPILLILAVLLVLTAVFDSLIILSGIVDYTEERILGWRIGLAPVEDFFYAVLAGIMMPTLWNATAKRKTSDD